MSSNFDLGLGRRSQAPWLGGQLGAPMAPDAPYANAMEYAPEKNAASNTTGPQGSRTSSIGQPSTATRPQDSPQAPPDNGPQAPKASGTSQFWQGLLSSLGARHPIAAVLGSLGSAKANADQANYQTDRQSWLDKNRVQNDQAKIDLERAQGRRADAAATAQPAPYWDSLNYQTPENRPASGVGPVMPKHTGVVAFNRHGSQPPQLPEGAEPFVKPDQSVSSFEAWREQNPNANPLDYEKAKAGFGARAAAATQAPYTFGQPEQDEAGNWFAPRANKVTGKSELVPVDAPAGAGPKGKLSKSGVQREKKPGLMEALGADKQGAGAQAPPAGGKPALSDFHVNPKTGERIGWDGKNWVPAPQ